MNTGKQEDLKAAYRSAPLPRLFLPITNVLVSPPHIQEAQSIWSPRLSRGGAPFAEQATYSGRRDRGSASLHSDVGARPVLAR